MTRKTIATAAALVAVAAAPASAAAPSSTPAERIAALTACTQVVYEDGSVVHVDVDPDFAGGPAMSRRCANWVGHYVGGGGYGRDRQAVLNAIQGR